MTVALQISKVQHRYDTVAKPVLTASGLTGAGRLLLADQTAEFIANGAPGITWSPLNRTYENAPIKLYETFGTTWTTTAGVSSFPLGLQKLSGGLGYSGAFVDTTFAGTVGVEGRSASAAFLTGVSLQSGTVNYNWADAAVEHALIFGNGGIGEIWELGTRKLSFRHVVGDSVLLVRENGIVKYYHFRGTDGAITLLRSTRSKLATDAYPVAHLYHEGAVIDGLAINIGTVATASTSIYGVLTSDFQDWENPGSIESLAEKTMNKDKGEDFTYFTEQQNLITLSLNLGWRDEEEYQAFREFYQWHDLNRPFIFIDSARAKLKLNRGFSLKENEMFARFVSAWKDSPLGGYLYGVTVDIREVVAPPVLFYEA
jgi:hypothetical protein